MSDNIQTTIGQTPLCLQLLLLAVDKVYAKIRNEKYQYILGQQTLFPEEVFTYDAKVSS